MNAALTGGIGCGKSFVLSCFSELGWAVIDCDSIARETMDNDDEVRSAVRSAFGNEYFGNKDQLDRRALAARVFENPSELARLENILLPKINKTWRDFLVKTPGNTPAIVEIPLLFEKNLEKFFDLSVCVTTDEETQLTRLEGRGFGRNEALPRIRRQLSLRDKEQRADIVISNNGNKNFTRAQVALLASRIH